MIGIAGIHSPCIPPESLHLIRRVHETPGVDLNFLTFHNDQLSAGVLMRSELAFYEASVCRYEDEEYLFMMEGMLSQDGPLTGVDPQDFGKRICTLFKKSTGLLSKINGEFVILVYEKGSGRLRLLNDRFASRPFFYSLTGVCPEIGFFSQRNYE